MFLWFSTMALMAEAMELSSFAPSIDGTRQEHAGRDIPYGDRKT